MNDKPSPPDDATVTALRNRRTDLARERDLIDARLVEVNYLLDLVETPRLRRMARQPRTIHEPPRSVQEPAEDQQLKIGMGESV